MPGHSYDADVKVAVFDELIRRDFPPLTVLMDAAVR